MRREDPEVVREGENLLVHGAVENFGAALLEIRSAATANQQRVSGEGDALLVHDVSHAA